MSNEAQPPANQPSQSSEIEVFKFGTPNRATDDLLPVLAQALQAQVQAGNTSAIDKIIEL
ncbi:MAG: hypothetical protein RLZZ511_970 [Cyanobacteriota bacterium]|jgi:hypothetical protein